MKEAPNAAMCGALFKYKRHTDKDLFETLSTIFGNITQANSSAVYIFGQLFESHSLSARLLAVSLIIIGSIDYGFAKTPAQIYREVSGSVVTIFVKDSVDNRLLSFGSGIVFADNIVATNCHVIESWGGFFRQIHGSRVCWTFVSV